MLFVAETNGFECHVPIFRPPSGVAVFLDKQNVVG